MRRTWVYIALLSRSKACVSWCAFTSVHSRTYMSAPCVFCDIVSGHAASRIVWQDEQLIAFEDIRSRLCSVMLTDDHA
jgi:hypothetical protein